MDPLKQRHTECNPRAKHTAVSIAGQHGADVTSAALGEIASAKHPAHVPAPYPDRLMHLTALFMIAPFTEENGGTLVVPGSHRASSNPTDKSLGIDPTLPYPTEYRVIAPAGSLLLFDSRLWHCPPGNSSKAPRVALGVRYAPWWLNLEPLDPDSDQRRQLVTEPGLNENIVPRIQPQV